MGSFLDTFKNVAKKEVFAKKETSVIGVDVGSSAIKIVQLKKENGVAVLETYGELSLGPYENKAIGRATNLPAERLAEALKDLLKESGVTTTNSGFSIPFASSLLAFIEMPSLDMKNLNKMIPIEARKYIPVPITEVMLDWFVVPEGEDRSKEAQGAKQTKEVLLVAIHNEVLSNYNTIVEQSGLTTDFFEIEIFSTIRSLLDQNKTPAMVMDIGAATTKVYIVEYGVVRVSHIINRGSQDVTQSIAKSLNITPADAEEIKRRDGLETDSQGVLKVSLLTLDYIFSEANRVLLSYQRKNKKNVGRVVLTGGGSIMKGVPELAKKHLETNVELGNPFGKVSTPAFIDDTLKSAGAEFSVAIGLALRKLQDFDG